MTQFNRYWRDIAWALNEQQLLPEVKNICLLHALYISLAVNSVAISLYNSTHQYLQWCTTLIKINTSHPARYGNWTPLMGRTWFSLLGNEKWTVPLRSSLRLGGSGGLSVTQPPRHTTANTSGCLHWATPCLSSVFMTGMYIVPVLAKHPGYKLFLLSG